MGGGYGDFAATARAADILATRWTPLVVRDLLVGRRSFNEIRHAIPGISPTVLTDRLRMLERTGVVDRSISPTGHVVYDLTAMGRALEEVVRLMGEWGERWLAPAPAHRGASAVLWKLSRLLSPDDLPRDRVVVRFDIHDDERPHYWLLLDRPDHDVSDRPPSAPDDLIVATSGEWLTRWFAGRTSIAKGRSAGLVAVSGPPRLERMLDRWGGLGSWLESTGSTPLVPRAVPASW